MVGCPGRKRDAEGGTQGYENRDQLILRCAESIIGPKLSIMYGCKCVCILSCSEIDNGPREEIVVCISRQNMIDRFNPIITSCCLVWSLAQAQK